MARRGLWVIGGMAVGVGALVLRPDTRTWLRRRLGLEAEDRRWFEDENGEPAEHEGDEPLDTREARFSLRARLAEEGMGEPAPAVAEEAAAEEAPPFAPPPPPPVAATPYVPPVAPPPVTPASEPEPEPEPAAALPEEPPVSPPAPAWAPPPAAAPPPPAPVAPAPEPVEEAAPEPGYLSYEAVPAVRPEADAPKTPGEDTNEIEPLPPVSSWEPPPAPAPAAAPPPPRWEPPAAAPPPPPTELRPSTPPPAPAPRPFSSEGASFRSAIDAARERVHGAAREATPEDGEAGDPDDERP